MKDKLKLIIITAIITIIILVIFLIFFNNKQIDNTELVNSKVYTTNTIVNSIDSEDENNITDENNTNTIQDNKNENVIGREEKESEQEDKDSSSASNDKKALELVKKEWGEEDNNVYFNIANKNGKKYTISVHNSETTQAVAWYDVDLTTGKVDTTN